MKCTYCHGEIETQDKKCPYCNYDNNKVEHNRKKLENFIYGIMKWDKALGVAMIIAFVLFVLEFFTDKSTGSGILITIIIVIHAILVILALIFVGWIGVSLLVDGIKHIHTNNNSKQITGYVVDNKNEKEIYDGGKGFFPIIEFKINERKYRVLGEHSKNKVELNKEYQVFCNVDEPYIASTTKNKSGWKSIIFAIIIILALLLVIIL